jgi:hypothetical protein
MELTNREYEVVSNVYGDDTPPDLREIDTQQLVAMHDRVTDAVRLWLRGQRCGVVGDSVAAGKNCTGALHSSPANQLIYRHLFVTSTDDFEVY